MKNTKIAVVDSGIGGLSLLKTLISNLNIKNYIYFADLKNIPYGSKTREQLLCLTIKNIKFLIKNYKPDFIVFGCNTIGSSILDDLKKIFPEQKIYAIKPQIKGLKSKTLVIATSATINSLFKTKEYKNNKKNIVLCKMPKLATKVENYIRNDVNLVPYLKRKLSKFDYCKNIVLGCTHYYFVKNEIHKILPNTQVLDGRNIVLKQIKKQLNSFEKIKNSNHNFSKINIKWWLTAHSEKTVLYKNTLRTLLKK